MSELPRGWAETTIGEVTRPFETIDPRVQPSTTFRYIDIGSIDNSRHLITEPKTFLGRDAPSRARRIVEDGDVLFSTVRTYLKNIAVVPDDLDGALTSTGIAVLRPSEAVDGQYLFRWVSSEPFIEAMSKAQDGTMYPAVTDRDVASGHIPLPPRAEQRRIVVKLDHLLARTARAMQELDRIPGLVANYKHSLLAAAFAGRLIGNIGEDSDFRAKPLSEVLHSTFYGPRFSRDAYDASGIVTLRTTDFDDEGNIKLKSPPAVRVTDAEFSKWGLVDGDLLVTRTGSIGKCALYSAEMGPALPSAYLIRVRLNKSQIRPRYALLFLLSRSGQAQLGLGITAVTQPNINAGVIERLELPIPSLQIQDEIIRLVELAFDWLDTVSGEHLRAARLVTRLDQAMRAKAFRGGLVPQDPTDEPASMLLERIRAARAVQPKPKRGRTPRVPTITHALREGTSMTKSRQDDDVKGKPYLAGLLRQSGGSSSVEDLFKRAEMPITDFYKQLAWEVDADHIRDDDKQLEAT